MEPEHWQPIAIIPSPELQPTLVHSQQQLKLFVTSFELAVVCPVNWAPAGSAAALADGISPA